MKRRYLYRIAQLTRRIDDYRFNVFNNIRIKRLIYLLIFTPPLIIACLSYGNFIQFSDDSFIKGNEIYIAFFCFMDIASSIYVLGVKRHYYSITDFINLSDGEAEREIRKMKKKYKETFVSNIKNVASRLLTIFSVICIAVLTFFKNGKVINLGSTDFNIQLAIFSWCLLLISFTVGDILKMLYQQKNTKIERGPEINTRNIFIDNLSISKINPELR